MTDDELAARRTIMMHTPLDLLTMAETVDLAKGAMTSRRRLQQVVINVAKLVNMRSNPDLQMDVTDSDVISIDGMGVLWAARLLGFDAKERVTGIDLMHALIACCARNGFKPYFLGAGEDILQKAIANFRQSHPGLEIAGYRNGYFIKDEEDQVVTDIRNSGADCLFVAISTPMKERFLHQHRDQLGVPYLMGVGGSLDVVAGEVSRAPLWMQKRGLEWLYRLLQEPRRMWRRYLVTNTKFAFLLLFALISKRLSRTMPNS